MIYAYPAKLTKGEDGRYLVEFPDLPEALTDGATRQEALGEAADCVSEAVASRIVDGDDIPRPSPMRRGQHRIPVDPIVAMKAALYSAMAERGINAASLAQALDVDHKVVRRLLDPRYQSKLPRLQEALAVVGRHVVVAVHGNGTQAAVRAA